MRGDMANIIGSSFLEVASVNGFISDTMAAWEVRGFGEAEHD